MPLHALPLLDQTCSDCASASVCLAAVASALAWVKMQLSVTRCTVLYVSEYTFAGKVLAGVRVPFSAEV